MAAAIEGVRRWGARLVKNEVVRCQRRLLNVLQRQGVAATKIEYGVCPRLRRCCKNVGKSMYSRDSGKVDFVRRSGPSHKSNDGISAITGRIDISIVAAAACQRIAATAPIQNIARRSAKRI